MNFRFKHQHVAAWVLILSCSSIFVLPQGRAQSVAEDPPATEAGSPRVADNLSADSAKSYFHFLRAQEHLSDNNLTEADTDFQEAIRYQADSAELRYRYAEFLLHIQNMEEASRQLEKCLELDPEYFTALRMLARLTSSSLSNLPPHDPKFKQQLDKAIRQYEKVLEFQPNDGETLFELGKLYMNINALDKAEKYFTEYIEKSGETLEGLYYLTMALVQNGKFEQALECVKKLEEERPNWYQIRLLKADILNNMGDSAAAEELYGKLLEISPSDPAPYLNYGMLLARSNREQEALEILEKAKERSAVNGELLSLMGQIYRNTYQFDKAIAAYKDAIALDPSYWEHRFNLGVTYSRMGDNANGITIFQSLVRDTESSGTEPPAMLLRNRQVFLLNLGFLFVDSRRVPAALETFERLRYEYPEAKEPAVYLQLAELYRGLDQVEKALEVLKAGLNLLPENPRLLAEKGVIQIDLMGQGSGVISEYESRFTEEENRGTDFYQGLATLHYELKQYDEALVAIDSGLKLESGNISLLFQKATIEEKAKRYDAAKNTLNQLLELDPDNANAWNFMGYMLIDYDLDIAKGVRFVNKALQFEPKNAAFLDSLGWGHFKMKQYESALKFLEQAAQGIPDDPTIAEHMGDVLAVLGRSHEARSYYERSLEGQEEADRQEILKRKMDGLKPKLFKNKD